MVGIWTRADRQSNLVDVLNQVIDNQAGNIGAAASRPNRHVYYDAWGDVFRSTGGSHLAVLLAATAPAATPSTSNSVLLVQDAAVSVGQGKALRLYETGGVDYAELTSTDGAIAVGGSGANVGILTGLTSLALTTSLSIGTTPATAGSVRLNTTGSVTSRNTGNTANISMLSRAATDIVILGDGTNAVTTRAEAATDVRLRIGATDVVTATSALLSTTLPLAIGATPALAGSIRMTNATSINARNNGNSANVAMASVNASDQVILGDNVNSGSALLQALTDVSLKVGATSLLTVNATSLNVDAGTFYVDITNNRVGVLTTSPASSFDVAGYIRTTNTAGAPGSGAGLEISYNTGLGQGLIRSFDAGSPAYKALAFTGSDLDFQASGTSRFRADNTGIGFFNHARSGQITVTGSKGANAALASLLTALAAYGLIVDSST